MSKRTYDTILVSPKSTSKRRTSGVRSNLATSAGAFYQKKAMLSPELKVVDRHTTAAVPPAGSWIPPTQISIVTIGGNINNRVGRKVTMKKLLIRLAFQTSQAIAPLSDATIRVLVVYDRAPNGTIATITSVLDNDSFTSPMNLDNRDRFVVIADQMTTQNVGKNNNATQMVINRKFNYESIYNLNNNGDIGDVNTGVLYVMYCKNETASLDGIGVSCRSRVRFTDF